MSSTTAFLCSSSISGCRIPANGLSLLANRGRLSNRRLLLAPRKVRNAALGPVRVRASLFGVGAPEVLVIAVVSLIVFGPKGLAEVVRSIGKSLREFQPTIRELQNVSKDFKQALQTEIGLDELKPTSTSSYNKRAPAPAPATTVDSAEPKPYSAEDYLRVTEEQVRSLVSEEDRRAAEAQAWGGSVPIKPAGQDAETPALTTETVDQIEKSKENIP